MDTVTDESLSVDQFFFDVQCEIERGRHWNAGQRAGQWSMNRLRVARPDVYVAVTGRCQEDPFYDDGKLEAFWLMVIELW